MLRRRAALIVALVWLLGVMATGAWAQTARLASYSGTVKIQRGGSGAWYKVTRSTGRNLYPGDHVQTYQRARAKITMGGAVMNLGPRTHVVIPSGWQQRQGSSRLRTVAGQVWVWLVGGRTVELGNNVAVASAHGTKFLLEVLDEERLRVTVLEGTVSFANPQGRVWLGPNEQSTATLGSAPTRPQRVDPAGLFEWEASPEALWLPWEMPGQPDDLEAHEAELRAVVTADPNDVAAWTDLGWNLLAQGRPGEAVAAFADAERLEAAGVTPLVGQGVATAATGGEGSLQAAQALVDRALARDAQSPLALLAQGLLAMRSGDAAAARRALEQALLLDADLYQAHAYLATVELSEHQLAAARLQAAQAVTLAPASGLALESQALVEFFAGNADAARQSLQAALAANPSSPTGHLLASDLYALEGDLDQAFFSAQTAVALDPGLAPAWSALGFLALAQNDLRLADRAFTRALELAPRLVAARTGMGVTYAREGRLARALEAQEGAVALDSSHLAAQNNLGAVYLGLGRLEEAATQFRAVIAAQPEWAVPYVNLALAYLELQRYAEALAAAEQGVRLGANSPRAHTTLARVYLRQNRVNQAWAQLRRALDLDETFALAHLEMAEVYSRLGNSREALRHQTRALALQPGALAESRGYSRTEATLAGGSLLADVKTDGRWADGETTYYARLAHERDDGGRAHSDWDRTSAVAMVGQQSAADSVDAGYLALQRENRDRPGRLLGAVPEDTNFTSRFTGVDLLYLGRRDLGSRESWSWTLGYLHTEEQDENPDALTVADAKPFRLMTLTSRGPTAEARYDRTLGSRDALTAGVAWFGETRDLSGIIGQPQPPGAVPPIAWTPFSEQADRDAATFYLWRQWQPGQRVYAMLGGRLAARKGMEPVLRPEGYLRLATGGHGHLVLLTRALLADDVSALSPVQDWGLGEWLSPLDLALGGYTQSHEVQYELLPSNGSLLRLSLFRREARNFLVDLQDPQWSAGAAGVILGAGTLTGGELAAETSLGRNLSAGLWARVMDTRNEDLGNNEIPYQPRLSGQVRLDYLGENGLRAGVVWVHVGRRYADLANTTRLGSYSVVNLRVDWQQNLHTAWFVMVENLLDEDYAYWQDYPAPGRKARVGINYRW